MPGRCRELPCSHSCRSCPDCSHSYRSAGVFHREKEIHGHRLRVFLVKLYHNAIPRLFGELQPHWFWLIVKHYPCLVWMFPCSVQWCWLPDCICKGIVWHFGKNTRILCNCKCKYKARDRSWLANLALHKNWRKWLAWHKDPLTSISKALKLDRTISWWVQWKATGSNRINFNQSYLTGAQTN